MQLRTNLLFLYLSVRTYVIGAANANNTKYPTFEQINTYMEGNANASLGKFTLLVQISTYVGTADATEEKFTPFVQMWKVPLILHQITNYNGNS